MLVLMILFFKQKTAYEMRISDWSSDVCSSDLQTQPGGVEKLDDRAVAHRQSGVSVITIKRTTERVGGDGRRQFAHQLWRTHGNCRIGLPLLFAEQIAEPAAQRRQITMQAGRLAPGTALAAEPVADQMRVDLFDACDMRGRAIAGELIEIASRGGDGMDREVGSAHV